MTPIIRIVAAALLGGGIALAAGCASAPAPQAAAASPFTDCAQLRADIADTEASRRAAQAQEQDAWKAVVPFAVAARYARSKSATRDADARLEQLDTAAQRQGCERAGS
jgi:hypothetical protein